MEALYQGDTMSKSRTMNELRQTKDAYYRVPRMLNPSKEYSKQLNHHNTIYSNSDIKTPVEWLAANDMESETRNMEGYAGYYVDQLIKMKLLQ